MWVAWNVHATGGFNVVGTIVVQEAPCANEAALLLRQGAEDCHGAWAAQGDFTGSEDFNLSVGRDLATVDFSGAVLQIAHVPRLCTAQNFGHKKLFKTGVRSIHR